jgi:hypothetical protein
MAVVIIALGPNCRGGSLWPPQRGNQTGVATEGHPYSSLLRAKSTGISLPVMSRNW